MITNPTLQILNSFAKLKFPEKEAKPKSMGMMSRSRTPVQEMSDTKKQPAMIAKEIQLKDYPEGSSGRYIVNHTKKEYVDKDIVPEDKEGWKVHPLPLLTCEGNGRGGGDYRLWNEFIGYWSRDKISIEK